MICNRYVIFFLSFCSKEFRGCRVSLGVSSVGHLILVSVVSVAGFFCFLRQIVVVFGCFLFFAKTARGFGSTVVFGGTKSTGVFSPVLFLLLAWKFFFEQDIMGDIRSFWLNRVAAAAKLIAIIKNACGFLFAARQISDCHGFGNNFHTDFRMEGFF